MSNLFIDVGTVIVIATLVGITMRLLKQPVIIGYILSGIISGPYVLNILSANEAITALSEIGVAILLLIAGLELDINRIRKFGIASVVTGLGQVIFTFIISFLFVNFAGYNYVVSGIISIAITFSSTVIAVKLLCDKNELNTVHGRLSLGILLTQDFVAILVLAFLSSPESFTSAAFFGRSFLLGALLFAFAIFSGIYIIPSVFKWSKKDNGEIMYLLCISWCFLLCIMAVGTGFSMAIGAFLSGISLASSPFKADIASMIKPLRDFFATIFFAALGLTLDISSANSFILEIIVLSIFVIFGETIITAILIAFAGYSPRTSFLTAISLAQVSEFSLIVVSLAFAKGLVGQDIVSLITFVMIITITVSAYLINYDDKIYRLLYPIASKLKMIRMNQTTGFLPSKPKYRSLLVGTNKLSLNLIDSVKDKNNILVVDFNPDIISELNNKRVPCIYGELLDPEVIERIKFRQINFVFLTFVDKQDKIEAIKMMKKYNKNLKIVCIAYSAGEAVELHEDGADYVEVYKTNNVPSKILVSMINNEFSNVKFNKLDKNRRKKLYL